LLGRVELPVQRVLSGLESAGIAVRSQMRAPTESKSRIHATYHQTVSVTGAVSSNPNLRGIRTPFVAGDGYAGLLTARFEALEMQVLAQLAGNAGITETHPADSHRLRTVSRALAYRWSTDEVADALRVSKRDAKELVAQYLSGLVRGPLASAVQEAHERGYAATLLGRRRYLPHLNSAEPVLRQAAERAACVMAWQGGVADVIKVAMINVEQGMKAAGYASRMVGQIDERLVFEMAPGEYDAVQTVLRDQMACAYRHDVPLHVTVEF
jgi:DNA polymerase I-like protein with 3'-5' exonuclease and polymerase domains